MEKKYRVVAYMRIEPEGEIEGLTYEEARMEVIQLSLQQPENIYQLERIEED
jgi:hypothetical protein